MINRELAKKIDSIQNSVTWLVEFAQKTEPRLGQLEFYADMLPGFQAVAADLKIENERLRNRQNNTAIVFGKITTINAGANPPRIEVHSSTGNKFIAEIPEGLFDAAMLKVGSTVRIGARLKNHATQRGVITIFYATSIEIVQSAVDDISEAGYNGN